MTTDLFVQETFAGALPVVIMHHPTPRTRHQAEPEPDNWDPGQRTNSPHQADSRVPILCRYSIKISDTLNADRPGDCLLGPASLTRFVAHNLGQFVALVNHDTVLTTR